MKQELENLGRLKPILNKEDYDNALNKLETLWSAEIGTPEHDYLGVLGILIADYEDKHYPVENPDPVEAVLFHLEQNGLDRADLGKLLNSRSRASEFFNRKRDLSLSQVRKICDVWHIPADILIRPVLKSAGD